MARQLLYIFEFLNDLEKLKNLEKYYDEFLYEPKV